MTPQSASVNSRPKMSLASTEILEENVKLRDEVAELKMEVKDLLAKLRFISGQRFATSQSEKMAPLQGCLFNEAEVTAPLATAEEQDDDVEVGAHKRKRKKRKPLPEHLPRQIHEYDLAEADRLCEQGHGPMERTGTAVSEQLEYQPATYLVHRHECATYGCIVCDAKKAATPSHPQPLPGTMATPSLLAHIIVSKYQDHLPLYRQEGILARDGIFITRTTLATWVIKAAERLAALLNLLHDGLNSYDIVQMDETRIQVLSLPGKSAKSNSYMWVAVGGHPDRPVVVFEFDPTRAGSVASRLLEDFSGYLQADAYGGYNAVAKRDDLIRLGCLMHIRRPFHDAYQQLKDVGGGEVTKQALALIQAVYKVEGEAKADPKAGRGAMTAGERQALRAEKMKPLLDALHAHAEKHLGLVRPSSLTGKALSYCLNEWPNFIRILDDGRLELDNGRAERAIRPLAQGRRAWLFADSEAGAKASAGLFSLTETAKLNGRDPRRYFQYVFERIDRVSTLADLEALLPWNAPPHHPSG